MVPIPLRSRQGVLMLLILLAIIMYLDRICISIPGPCIQEAFGITSKQWGLVLGAFTMFTALATGYWSLVIIRFLLGTGEAGALPNIGIVLARWFPSAGRAKAMGIICMAMQAGAVISPFLVVPLQMKWGWQASFFVFGALGIVWALAWYALYRDELGPETHSPPPHTLPLSTITQPNILACMAAGFCYVFGLAWSLFWMPSFLVKGRSFTESQLLLTSIPPVAGALGNFAGGWASDRAVRAWGLVRGRRSMGILGLIAASGAMLGAAIARDATLTMATLSI